MCVCVFFKNEFVCFSLCYTSTLLYSSYSALQYTIKLFYLYSFKSLLHYIYMKLVSMEYSLSFSTCFDHTTSCFLKNELFLVSLPSKYIHIYITCQILHIYMNYFMVSLSFSIFFYITQIRGCRYIVACLWNVERKWCSCSVRLHCAWCVEWTRM